MFTLNRPLILASNSPRRKQLLSEAGFLFEVKVLPIDESFPVGTPAESVAGLISTNKARAFLNLNPESIVLTADTVVVMANDILGKPADADEARCMLEKLSGNAHEVVTAISLLADGSLRTFSDTAKVYFRALSSQEIDYYISQYQPFDKAGSYGIQEWIGMIGITKIEGSFYTIMGLPVHLVYDLLKPYMR
jgi:septum formation protein